MIAEKSSIFCGNQQMEITMEQHLLKTLEGLQRKMLKCAEAMNTVMETEGIPPKWAPDVIDALSRFSLTRVSFCNSDSGAACDSDSGEPIVDALPMAQVLVSIISEHPRGISFVELLGKLRERGIDVPRERRRSVQSTLWNKANKDHVIAKVGRRYYPAESAPNQG